MFQKSAVIFPSKHNAIFLSHCAVSPLFSGAAKAINEFVSDLASSGIAALSKYTGVMHDFHRNYASLLKTSPENISYVRNTGEALSMLANGYPFESGDRIISYIHEYPSNHYPWVLQKKRGVELLLLKDSAASQEYEDIPLPVSWSMEELDKLVCQRTRIVAVSHVQFTSGFAADLMALGTFCRDRGIDLVVDCAQSLGSLPVYPEEFNISAMVASGWKWLLGLKGSAVMYTSPEFREKIAATMGGPGMMQQGLEYLDHSWNPYSDGRKYEYSTIPWDHVAGMNRVAEEIFLKHSPEEIREEIFRLQDLLLAGLDTEKVQILRFPKKNRSGIIAAYPQKNHGDIVRSLAEKGVVITAPVGYLRLAPHFYNDDEQITRAAGLINDSL